MPLVLVAEYSDRIAADVARLTLASEGIEAVLFDAGMASLGLGPITPVRLMVADDDRAAAERLLGTAA